MSKDCSVEGCELPAWCRTWCQRHYARWRRTGDVHAHLPRYARRHPKKDRAKKRPAQPAVCTIDGCEKPTIARGWCTNHYAKWRKYGDPLADFTRHAIAATCSIDGCERISIARGWCGKHYKRWSVHGDPHRGFKPGHGTGRRVGQGGYILLQQHDHPNAWDNGSVYEHVVVMSEMLGRPLYPGECVHHKNGVRSDNRPENLELWSRAHPPGQRVSELILFAHEILERYKDDVQFWPEWALPSS